MEFPESLGGLPEVIARIAVASPVSLAIRSPLSLTGARNTCLEMDSYFKRVPVDKGRIDCICYVSASGQLNPRGLFFFLMDGWRGTVGGLRDSRSLLRFGRG